METSVEFFLSALLEYRPGRGRGWKPTPIETIPRGFHIAPGGSDVETTILSTFQVVTGCLQCDSLFHFNNGSLSLSLICTAIACDVENERQACFREFGAAFIRSANGFRLPRILTLLTITS